MLHPATRAAKTEESIGLRNVTRDEDEVHPDYEAEQYDKFLSIPFVENEENDEESISRRMTAARLSKCVSYGICLAVVASLVTALAYYIDRTKNDPIITSDDSVIVLDVCYEAPSCLDVNLYQTSDPSTGFTNNTGWSSASLSSNTCCNICLPGVNQTVCFPTSSAEEEYAGLWSGDRRSVLNADDTVPCEDKTGNGDYDYVMLDQIYFPQWCNALREGHDPTLSHLTGTRCTNATTSGPVQLNIHGLWPNYLHGYPQCCKFKGTQSVSTVLPADIQTFLDYPALMKAWYDPTTDMVNNDGLDCATCYLLNHEWQKHGSCFTNSQETYFGAGLKVHESLSNQSRAIEAMNGTVVKTADIAAMYNYTVNVICDPQATYVPPTGSKLNDDTIGVFLELQSCWDVVVDTLTAEEVLAGARDDWAGGVATVISDEATGKVIASSVSELKDLLLSEDGFVGGLRSSGRGSGWKALEVNFFGRDCATAAKTTFTKPCPEYAYVGTYNV